MFGSIANPMTVIIIRKGFVIGLEFMLVKKVVIVLLIETILLKCRKMVLMTEEHYKMWKKMNDKNTIRFILKNTIANCRKALILIDHLDKVDYNVNEDKVTKKLEVVDYIEKLDKKGKNISKEELFQKFSKDKYKDTFLNLLYDGEFFSIKNIIYPLKTKNL